MTTSPLDERYDRYADTRDPNLRNELIIENRGLAIAFARRYAQQRRDEDLEQIALEALIVAIDRFEPERGLRFSTYAARVIDGRLKQHFRDDSWDVRVPRSLKQLATSIRNVTEELTASLARAPSPAELAEHLGVTVDQIALALDAASSFRAEELDTDPATDDVWERVDANIVVPELLERLPPRERAVVTLRFYADQSQSQIAEHVGVSQMQVSRLLRRALDRMRALASDG